jgi:acetyl-CoA carboxylase biotin carboxyl carrier protein
VPAANDELGDDRPTPERVAELVRSLADVMRQSDVTELDLALGALNVRLRRPARADHPEPSMALSMADGVETILPDSGHVITAPMVGTFYRAPTPSAAPFVSVGDTVIAGQTIGIIEAMKIMNEIAADQSGVVAEFLAGNGQPVEYGSPLMRLDVLP